LIYKDSGVAAKQIKPIFVLAENLDGKKVFAIHTFGEGIEL
jgi:hypothetical protein